MGTENNINVEEIMKQIKADINAKGYTNDLLSFDDVIVDVSSMKTCMLPIMSGMLILTDHCRVAN